MLELNFEFPEFKGDNQAEADLAIRQFMNDVADYLQDSFQRHVPFDTGDTYDAIRQSRVNKTPAGYTVDVGVDPISHSTAPEYPLYVHQGTGVFVGRDFIRPQHGNVIAFEKPTGETVFTTRVVGQAPQPYIDKVEAETNTYIEGRKRELGVVLSKLL